MGRSRKVRKEVSAGTNMKETEAGKKGGKGERGKGERDEGRVEKTRRNTGREG